MEHTPVIVDLSKHNMVTKTTDLTMLYSVYQRKGQIQATFKNVPIPERGSEVFIGNIPYGTLLQDLLEFGLKAGAIYQIRLLLEFSGRSRRYCFIKYFSPQSARKAVLTLNGGLLNRCHVIVKLSFDNNSLEIGDIPRELCFDQLKGQLQQVIGDGLKEVKLQKYPYLDCNKCLLVYDTHSNAAHARKKVYPTFRLLGHTVRIDWKVPVELKMCSRLYFRNLPSTVTKMQLCDSLLEHLCIDSMLNIFLQRGIGYIVFVTSYQAYQAYKTLSEKPICGVYLEYSFSRFFEEMKKEPEESAAQEDALPDDCVQPLQCGSIPTASTTPPPLAVPTPNGYLPAINGCSTAPLSMTTPLIPTALVQPSPFESMQPAYIPVMMTPPSSAVPTPNGYLPAINGSSTTPLSMTTPLIPTALVQPSLSGSMQLAFTPVMMTPPSSAVPTSNGYLPAYNGCSTAPPSMTTPLHTPLVQTSSSVYSTVMMPPQPSAVPASNCFPTMNGCLPALPPTTTPLPTLLPYRYYFNNANVNHQLSGFQGNTYCIRNQTPPASTYLFSPWTYGYN